MVSTDHFRQGLLAQLDRAATQGRIDVLINSGELCRSITKGSSGSASCCDAMQEELGWEIRCFLTDPTEQG
jgi:hypothetical protein